MNSIETAKLTPGQKVFVRCDIDVPIKNGIIKETYRLDNLLPTLLFLRNAGVKITIAGHIGKPNGRIVDELRTKQLLPYFNEKLGEGTFELLENLRFVPSEEANDPEFAQAISHNADIYVNESFATSHRAHASIVGIAPTRPSYAGLRLMKEVETLKNIISNPERPLVAVIGGAKIESKLPVITKFMDIADAVLVGGKIGLQWTGDTPEKLYLPRDYAREEKDIGLSTIRGFKALINTAKTVVWAGPMGLYEEDDYAQGTLVVAMSIIASGAFSVIGGGDTIAAVNKMGLMDHFNFISTGGSAMLEFLSKGTLPGLEVLDYHG